MRTSILPKLAALALLALVGALALSAPASARLRGNPMAADAISPAA